MREPAVDLVDVDVRTARPGERADVREGRNREDTLGNVLDRPIVLYPERLPEKKRSRSFEGLTSHSRVDPVAVMLSMTIDDIGVETAVTVGPDDHGSLQNGQNR